MLKRIAQLIVASAVVLTTGCAADQSNATADRQRQEIPVVTGAGDFIGSMMRGHEKHRRVREQPVIDVALTPVQE